MHPWDSDLSDLVFQKKSLGKDEISAVVGDFFGLKTCAALFSALEPRAFPQLCDLRDHLER